MSIEPLDVWFQLQPSHFYTNLAFYCKTETLFLRNKAADANIGFIAILVHFEKTLMR